MTICGVDSMLFGLMLLFVDYLLITAVRGLFIDEKLIRSIVIICTLISINYT
jgi:hypothetical protein